VKGIYDVNKTYLENADEGPFFDGEIPAIERPATKSFLGHAVSSLIGVPAGPLLNAAWIDLAGRLGFDIVTYKTIRSFAYAGNPMPNIVFVEPSTDVARRREAAPDSIEELSITNSFGMPSRSLDYLLHDIAKANASLREGQVMIVSVVGSPDQKEGFLEDFVTTARFAKSAGAKIIEANFSCPNAGKHEGCLYMSADSVARFTRAIATAIAPTPLILKMGLFPNEAAMRKSLIAAARGGAQGVAGINTISMRIIDQSGVPALTGGRITSGVCGAMIREEALGFIRSARAIIDEEKLGLTLIGCGGIMVPEHFDAFFQEGVDVAMSATGMMWNPYLAYQTHIRHRHG
jgi:dihydroorotate dehydrogenase